MAKPKLQVEIVPNQDCRLFHTNFKLCDKAFYKHIEGELASCELKELENASDASKKLAIGISGIAGVNTFSISTYQLQVVKAPLFDWEEIEPQITGLIQMIGHEMVGEEVEHIAKPIWEFQKWGLNADGTKRRRSMMDEAFDFDMDE